LNLVRNTVTSASSKATNRGGDGKASANQGSSHRLYCGEYTLLVSRKMTRSGNANVQARKSGLRALRANHTATATRTRRTSASTLIRAGDQGHPVPPSSRWHTTNHRLSQSG